MDDQPVKPLRADAERNRVRILEAAAAAFADGGLDVAVAEIARRAAVGPGTLFRRFPTKDDLVIAIVEQRVAEIEQQADAALAEPDPWTAFQRFMTAGVRLQVRDRGFFEAIGDRFHGDPRMLACKQRINAKVEAMLDRAQTAGVVRGDLESQDVLVIVQAAARAGCVVPGADADLGLRYLAILLDGLRPEAATPLPVAAPDYDVRPGAAAPAARHRSAS